MGRRGDVVVEGGSFRGAYGLLSGEWVLVRPDRYVGAGGVPELEFYLAKVGLAPLREAARAERIALSSSVL